MGLPRHDGKSVAAPGLAAKGVAVLLCALACTGLTACRSNVGTAAAVNGQRISESQVGGYIRPSGPDPSYVAQAKQQGQSVDPKTTVLQLLVEQKVFSRTLSAKGGLPSDAQLTAQQDTAAQVLLQTQLSGAKLTAALTRGLGQTGVTKAGVPLFLRVQSLEYTLVRRSKATSLVELVAAIKKAGTTVSVSPRYGSWDIATLSIKASGGRPGFLKLQPTPGVSVSASAQGGS